MAATLTGCIDACPEEIDRHQTFRVEGDRPTEASWSSVLPAIVLRHDDGSTEPHPMFESFVEATPTVSLDHGPDGYHAVVRAGRGDRCGVRADMGTG